MESQIVGSHQVLCLGKPLNHLVGDWGQSLAFAQIANTLADLSIRAAYIVEPSFQGEMLDIDQLRTKHEFPGSTIITGNGLKADALFLPAGKIGMIAPADCPTLVLSHIKTKQAVILHCGRDAILPRERRLRPSGEFYGVIDNVILRLNWELLKIRAGIFLGVSADNFSHPFAHPLYGEHNRRLVNFVIKSYGPQCIKGNESDGCIDLPAVIRWKLLHYGMKEDQIYHDGIDTASSENREVWWSVRRDGNAGRNLVIVGPK